MQRTSFVAVLVALVLGACARQDSPVREVRTALPLEVLADSAEHLTLGAAPLAGGPAAASARLLRVSPSRSALDAPLPDAAPAEPPAADASRPEPAPSDADAALRPPIPLGTTRFVVHGRRAGWVELDVRVDESGEATDAEFVSGDADSATVAAAVDAALATRWHPALLDQQPVAVWCRQRFEIRGR